MQTIRANCEACIGETREACDAAFSDLRDQVAKSIATSYKNDLENDIVGQMEEQDRAEQRGAEFGKHIASIGCQLNTAQLMTAFLLEASAGVTLGMSDLEEKLEAEESVRDAGIEETLSKMRQTISNMRSDFPLALDRRAVSAAEMHRPTSSRRQAAIEDYCALNSWQVDNLSFDKKFELKIHLKSLGLAE